MTGPRRDVAVGVCTYRRPAQLARLLRALADQQGADVPSDLEVVVVDNSPDEEGAEVVAAVADLQVRYEPLGAGNISIARNKVLEACARTRFVALLDDDEWPERQWLQALLTRQSETGADIVVGPVLPVFPPAAPVYLQQSGAYGVSDLDGLEAAREGITGNVLIKNDAVAGLQLRFDVRLGRSGGEDQLFFRQALARGAVMAYAPAAVAHEDVPVERLRAVYVLKGEYRRGNTLGLLDRGSADWPRGRPARRALAAAWWATSGLARLAHGLARRDRTQCLLAGARIARAGGMVAGLLGGRYDLYAVQTPRVPGRRRR